MAVQNDPFPLSLSSSFCTVLTRNLSAPSPKALSLAAQRSSVRSIRLRTFRVLIEFVSRSQQLLSSFEFERTADLILYPALPAAERRLAFSLFVD